MNARLDAKDLDPKDQKELEALASETGRNPGELLRELVHEALLERKRNGQAHAPSDEEETLYEAFNRQGLIGCVEGLPADLTTNPKHMEGFGRRD
jgi:hypothetical protein